MWERGTRESNSGTQSLNCNEPKKTFIQYNVQCDLLTAALNKLWMLCSCNMPHSPQWNCNIHVNVVLLCRRMQFERYFIQNDYEATIICNLLENSGKEAYQRIFLSTYLTNQLAMGTHTRVHLRKLTTVDSQQISIVLSNTSAQEDSLLWQLTSPRDC